MNETPPPLDLASIRARAEAASPGPWRHVGHYNAMAEITGMGGQSIEAGGCVACEIEGQKAAPDQAQDQANARFIAAARTDVPALCDEVEEQIRLRRLAEACARRARSDAEQAERERDEAKRERELILGTLNRERQEHDLDRAEIERLTKEVAHVRLSASETMHGLAAVAAQAERERDEALAVRDKDTETVAAYLAQHDADRAEIARITKERDEARATLRESDRTGLEAAEERDRLDDALADLREKLDAVVCPWCGCGSYRAGPTTAAPCPMCSGSGKHPDVQAILKQ